LTKKDNVAETGSFIESPEMKTTVLHLMVNVGFSLVHCRHSSNVSYLRAMFPSVTNKMGHHHCH